ncbi:MAG: murein biosynthesis integral membrane protein MurJ [Candidatus Portnoybacteria bacterium]|nr:murein biosynthesis integral membrane protein MurJ [Candidatus Portnoybacteria bacterium]
MVKRIINHKAKTIFSAAFILGAAALASRILGLVRDRLLAGRFGAGDELDIYFAAFRLPDLIYAILIMGAISSAFIPVFARYFKEKREDAWRLVDSLFNLAFIVLSGLIVLFIFLAPLLVSIIAPGFSGEKKEMTILLTRIMFLSPLLLGLSGIFGGVLQYFHRFFIHSLAPIMYNLGIIVGILFFVPAVGLIGLAWGVVLGSGLHLLIQLPGVICSGFSFKKRFSIWHKGIKRIIKLMIPRTVGLAGFQINFLVITAIASTLAAGSIAVFNLSYSLQYVPIGVIGISFATAAFPRLASSFANKDRKNFSLSFTSAFNQIIYLIIPLSVAFFFLRAQIVRIILGTGEFGWTDTRLTAAALGIFSFGVFAHGLVPLFSRAFYSAHNTKTPVFISLWSMLVNILGSLGFVWLLKNSSSFSSFVSDVLKLEGVNNFAVLGLPLAFVFGGIFNLIFIIYSFRRKIGLWDFERIRDMIFKVLACSGFMGFSIFVLLRLGDLFINTHVFWGILLQSVMAGVGGVLVYLFFSLIFKVPELRILMNKVFKKRINEKN